MSLNFRREKEKTNRGGSFGRPYDELPKLFIGKEATMRV